ncbi:FAD-binding oxidoreductase [Haloarculaceae archaeon H-GB2-1]|nr:FAD-binding oxidoreductase [Haloarculaceae archaeon H-GB2-1]
MPGVNVPDGTDVTIIGGGIMGAATAYFLAAESDRDVLLLEKDQIASGSTGDSSAIIRHHYGDKEVYSKTARWSHEFYREFDAELGESIAYEPNPMVRYGGQGDEASQAFAMSGYDTLEAMDIPVSRLEREELEERYPMLDFDGIEFGVSDDDAAYSDGTDVAGGFARAAQNEGATVVTGVAVEDIVVEDGAVAAVETDAKTVATDDVVVTAGPWTPRLLSQVGVEVPIETTREQILILDPPEDFVSAYPDLVPSGGPRARAGTCDPTSARACWWRPTTAARRSTPMPTRTTRTRTPSSGWSTTSTTSCPTWRPPTSRGSTAASTPARRTTTSSSTRSVRTGVTPAVASPGTASSTVPPSGSCCATSSSTATPTSSTSSTSRSTASRTTPRGTRARSSASSSRSREGQPVLGDEHLAVEAGLGLLADLRDVPIAVQVA